MTPDRSRPQTAVAPPRTINVQKFAESRASELETLHSIIKNRLSNDFRSQRSKRRRTTGHDNRVTKNRHRKKRKVGNNDVDKTDSLENDKEAPRRVRRRTELRMNPNSGFLTSGDGTKRLRTHIWHAKRFTMAKLWGFYLPLGLQGRGRGSRALLKKLKDSVLVHDASYSSVIQLEGPEDMLISILNNMIVPPPSQCENASQDILSGSICGNAMLHHYGVSFSSAIAPVTYMWQPRNVRGLNVEVSNVDECERQNRVDDFASSRRLWIFIHASAHKEGFEALQSACIQQITSSIVLNHQINASTCKVSCIPLDDRVAKLEVIGSRTLQVLKKTLHPATCSAEKSSLLKKCSVSGCDRESQFVKIFEEDQIPSFGVVSLTVVDPRAFTKEDIANAPDITALGMQAYKEHEIKGHGGLVENPKEECNLLSRQCLEFEESCDSCEYMDLWHVDKELSPPVEESILCMERHNQRMELFRIGDRISGASNTPNNMQFPRSCPLLLIKNYGQKSSIRRWSILLPLSWVKVFWISLITNGAHAIGLREKQWIACEAELPYFPSDFPDCNSYSCFMKMEAAAADEKVERNPPSMRPFGVPILPPWNSVHLALDKRSFVERNYQVQCKDFSAKERTKNSPDADDHCDNPFVGFIARTSYILSQFLDKINGSHLLLFPKFPNRKECISNFIKDEKMVNEHSDKVIYRVNYGPKLCFVRVLLHAYSKGFFEGGAVVCAPHVDDILLWTQRSGNPDRELQMTESSVRSYFVQQDGKWECQLPTDPSSRDSYRLPIGFVTTGFVQGSKNPVAVALCEAINLACLREDQWRAPSIKRRKEIYVLVRNLRSTAYRLAMANIILEQREEDIEYM
ncbi:PREDICTED: ribonucleases P/MRP protein subunit POP1-like isoform X1 [Ipomoea nil]|uniref:ribonucleases P/MRP protein subunit POP1-like isoform X1 n=1 Tax=Ipomoea nil TaxID=35883 RepID=UPI000900F679|nr:PREDICTED: ribonucleases P/MRP protein subunit POP1-like isoform X1 [Ipomoea nil]